MDTLERLIREIGTPAAIIDGNQQIVAANEVWHGQSLSIDNIGSNKTVVPLRQAEYSLVLYQPDKKDLLEEIADFILYICEMPDGSTRVVEATESFVNITGINSDGYDILSDNSPVHPEDRQELAWAIQKAKLNGRAKTEFRITTRNAFYNLFTAVLQWIESRNEIEILARQSRIYYDNSLQRLYGVYNQILANSQAFLHVTDTDGKVLISSAPDVEVGENAASIFGDDILPLIERAAQGFPGVFVASSSTSAFEVYVAPVTKDKDTVTKVAVFSTDFSSRKEFERETLRKLEVIDALINSIDVGIIMSDNSGNIQFFNSSALAILDVAPAEIEDQKLSRTIRLYPDTTGKALRLDDANSQTLLADNLSRMLYVKDKEGRLKNVMITVGGLFDASNIRKGLVIVVRDITAENITRNELEMERRLHSVGSLAGGLAHRFNNILMAISGNLELAQTMTAEPKVAKRLGSAFDSVEQARQLTKSLQVFAFGGPLWKRRLCLRELITNTVRFNLSGTGITPHFHISRSLRTVDVDAILINEALNNIIENSKEASKEGDSISVSALNISISDGDSLVMPEGEYVRISIADHGTGMKENELLFAIDPFFTTKEGRAGMGLSTAHSIVRSHSGYMKVESEDDAGTRVTFFLPASNILTGQDRDTEEEKMDSIIVQDADPTIREVISNMVSSLGYSGIQAETPGNALNLLDAELARNNIPAAVILNHGDIRKKLQLDNFGRLSPATKLLLSSDMHNCCEDFKETPFAAFLPKPFTLGELRTVLRNILHK